MAHPPCYTRNKNENSNLRTSWPASQHPSTPAAILLLQPAAFNFQPATLTPQLSTLNSQTINSQLLMTRTGKIARLPDDIRNQLNRRIRDGENGQKLLKWLNTLPEVRAVLAAEFHGQPVRPSNLTEWKKGGYRDWLVSQDARNLAHNLQDQHSLGHETLAGPFTAKLAQWAALYYASAAQSLVAAETQPKARWDRLRELCVDIARLRRGDLHAEQLDIERQWLALEESKSDQQRENEFKARIESEDVRARFLPPRPAGLSPESRRKIEDALWLMGDDYSDFAGVMQRCRLSEENGDYVI